MCIIPFQTRAQQRFSFISSYVSVHAMPAAFVLPARTSDSTLRLAGAWTLAHYEVISRELSAINLSAARAIDGSGISDLDTAGAWLLLSLTRRLNQPPDSIHHLTPDHAAIFALTAKAASLEGPDKRIKKQPPSELESFFIHIGRASHDVWNAAKEILSFIGESAAVLARGLIHPRRLRLASISRHVEEAGLRAVPIIALISFLISIVVSYQGADQLRQFGAELFTINLAAVSVLREMAVLLTAIMVAGRSGSAFTAEIGVMQVNEEVDAMRTLGLNPFEILVVPRLIALIIALPLLTFIADVMGMLGSAIICQLLLDIPFVQFFDRFRKAVALKDFFVGIVKAPVFAFLIGVIGCMQGMRVTGSAESVGRLTTLSVVQSIFLVLLADALFAVLFTKLGI